MLRVLRESNESCHHTPEELETGEPVAGSDVCEDDLGRDQHDAICDVEVRSEATS